MPQARIIDITAKASSKHLYKCLAPMPFRKHRRRLEYLKSAIPRGFRKKILFFDGSVVGQIEYAPPEASGYPIFGERIIVMNCIWVLRKAKGHGFGRMLWDSQPLRWKGTGAHGLGGTIWSGLALNLSILLKLGIK